MVARISGMAMPKGEVSSESFLGRVAIRLRELRIEKGLSAEKFAKELTKAKYKVSVNTIYSWEQARSTPHLEAFPALSKVLGVAISDILPSS